MINPINRINQLLMINWLIKVIAVKCSSTYVCVCVCVCVSVCQLTAVGDVAREFGNKEVQRQFAVTQKALQDGGFVTERSLVDVLDEPILRLRQSQDGYKHRARPRLNGLSRTPAHKTVYHHPGLLD